MNLYKLLTLACMLPSGFAAGQVYVAGVLGIGPSFPVAVAGDIRSAADITDYGSPAQNGTLLLNGSSMQQLNFDNHIVRKLQINNNAGIRLQSGLRIADTLQFVSGKAVLDAADLSFLQAAWHQGAGVDAYLVTDGAGVVKHEGLTPDKPFVFPVGRSSNAGDYTPAEVTNKTSGARDYSVSVKDYATSAATVPNPAAGVDRAWQIVSGTPGDTWISLAHNASTEGALFVRDTGFAAQQTNTGQWDIGTGTGTGNGGLTHYGAFPVQSAGTAPGAWFTKLSYPVSVFLAVDNNPVCAGDTVLFTASTPLTGVTINWTGPGGFTHTGNTAPIPNVAVANDGVYRVSVTFGHLVVTDSVDLVVNPLPEPSIGVNGNRLSVADYYTSYQWYRDTVKIDSAVSYKYDVQANATYSVYVTDSNGCSAWSKGYSVNNVGVAIHRPEAAVHIYPNPVSGVLYIRAPFPVSVAINGMDGRIVCNAPRADRIDLDALPDGIYMISVRDGAGMLLKTEKLVKAAGNSR